MPDREGDVRERVERELDTLHEYIEDLIGWDMKEGLLDDAFADTRDRILAALDTPQEPPEPVADDPGIRVLAEYLQDHDGRWTGEPVEAYEHEASDLLDRIDNARRHPPTDKDE